MLRYTSTQITNPLFCIVTPRRSDLWERYEKISNLFDDLCHRVDGPLV